MASPQILQYYQASAERAVRDDLIEAANLAPQKVAIDCGCGAGADIAYLLEHGFYVHGFDIEAESISRCEKRFAGSTQLSLTQASFTDFKYPTAGLIVADAALFFCAPEDFPTVWHSIQQALSNGGVFSGSFLGPKDSMAGPNYDKTAYWPNVLVFDEASLRAQFTHFNIVRFTEHNVSGTTPAGEDVTWHIYSVVAQKKD
jgi:SAM-dependent methyltransferase